ncbi:unnamed protein product [Dibothriocephalus latus]|uniref:E3 ubiquitin-protein ligase n=1 Tax=Dibothriocephalus latus TaxID=60516 RepID=A0A3P7LTF7_DIBLA|nr:unnamed protein product [Dibothriocephalus latus]
MVWYYEGRNGWWRYDTRTASEIEAAFTQSLQSCEVCIAGHIYIVDFTQMCQARKDRPGRTRRIKRDSADLEAKGIAGLRLSLLEKAAQESVVCGSAPADIISGSVASCSDASAPDHNSSSGPMSCGASVSPDQLTTPLVNVNLEDDSENVSPDLDSIRDSAPSPTRLRRSSRTRARHRSDLRD